MKKEIQASIVMPIRKIQQWTKRILNNLKICEASKINVEFIFVYNANVYDQSVERLKEEIDKNEYKIVKTYFHKCTEAGIYSAMNKGIKMAKGKVLLFMGADDIITKDFKAALNHICKSKSKCILAYALKNSEQNKTNNYKSAGGMAGQVHWILGMPRIHQAIFYNTEFVRSKKIHFRTDLKVTSDYIFTCEVLETMEGSAEEIDEIITIYNTTGFSSHYNAGQLYLEHIQGYRKSLILKKYFPLIIMSRLTLITIKLLKKYLVGKP